MRNLRDDLLLIEHLKGRTLQKNIRPLFLALGGGLGGSMPGWGATVALQRVGLVHFDYFVGVSAGSMMAAYLAAGQAQDGAALYYKELATNRFANWARFSKIFDLDFGEECLRYGKNRLNVARIKCASSQLYIGLTHVDTGEGLFVNAQDPSLDMVTAIKASVQIPGLYNQGVYPLPNKRCVDGAIAMPFPLQQLVREFKPTHVVIVMNTSLGQLKAKPPLQESLFVSLFPPLLRHFPWHIRQAMASRRTRFYRDFLYANQVQGVAIYFLPPLTGMPNMVSSKSDVLYRSFQQALVVYLTVLNRL